MISAKQIIEIFSYNADEQKAFGYLRQYMKLISKRLPEIESDRERLKRFALAGLFLTYRAFNHQGSEMTTTIGDISSDSISIRRLGAFKDYFGIEIKDTAHYLSMINFSVANYILTMLKIANISKKLYSFVVK